MYGDMLSAPGPMGAPPPVKGPPLGAAPPPAAAAPPPVPPEMAEALQGAQEAQQKAAYEAHLDEFVHHAAQDYAAKRISRDDLKKATAYTGTEPYQTWRAENIQHLKEHAKAAK